MDNLLHFRKSAPSTGPAKTCPCYPGLESVLMSGRFNVTCPNAATDSPAIDPFKVSSEVIKPKRCTEFVPAFDRLSHSD